MRVGQLKSTEINQVGFVRLLAGAAVGCRADPGIENSGRFGRGPDQYLVRQNEQANVGKFYKFPDLSIATANLKPSTAAIR